MLAHDSDVEDLLQTAVEVRVHVVAGPLEAEGVEALGEVGAADLATGGGAPEGVEIAGGTWKVSVCWRRGGRMLKLTPVDCAGVGVTSAKWVAGGIAADLCDINLSATRPDAVNVVLWDEPVEVLAMIQTSCSSQLTRARAIANLPEASSQ